MAKNIEVAAHVNRYKDTDLQDVVKLIEGLTELVDGRRLDEIKACENRLALLKNGEIPKEVKPEKPTRVTRGGKKVSEEA